MTNTTSNEIKQLDSDYIAQTYGRFNLALSHGKGCQVWDFEGNEYLDFTSGIGVNSLGWADEDWLKAVVHQASSLAHTSNLFFTEPSSRLAKKLAEASGLKRVFFANSGAEANEGAIKTARKYSHDKYGKDRATVLTLVNSFHGRTISTLSATGQEVFHQHFFPFTKGFDHTPANELRALETRLGQKDVCAIILEVVQGEGGVCSLDHEYLQGVQALCHQYDVLLIIDEVQTGDWSYGHNVCLPTIWFNTRYHYACQRLGRWLTYRGVCIGRESARYSWQERSRLHFRGKPCKLCRSECSACEN